MEFGSLQQMKYLRRADLRSARNNWPAMIVPNHFYFRENGMGTDKRGTTAGGPYEGISLFAGIYLFYFRFFAIHFAIDYFGFLHIIQIKHRTRIGI